MHSTRTKIDYTPLDTSNCNHCHWTLNSITIICSSSSVVKYLCDHYLKFRSGRWWFSLPGQHTLDPLLGPLRHEQTFSGAQFWGGHIDLQCQCHLDLQCQRHLHLASRSRRVELGGRAQARRPRSSSEDEAELGGQGQARRSRLSSEVELKLKVQLGARRSSLEVKFRGQAQRSSSEVKVELRG